MGMDTASLVTGKPVAVVARGFSLQGFTAMLDAVESDGLHLTGADGVSFTVAHRNVVRVSQGQVLVGLFAKEQRKARKAS